MQSQRRINAITVLLLVLGLGSALGLYLRAAPTPSDDLLLSDPRAQRKYYRELAMYGGKANVLSAEFMDWFDRQWHGEQLARTVAVFTVGATLAFRFVATRPEPAPDPAADQPTPKEPT